MSKSADLFARAQKVLPGGVSRNTVLRDPHPLYAVSGQGCRVTDMDGVERIDFANNMASLIHGHAHPEIVAAVSAQLARGSAFTLATEVEVEFAELLCSRNEAFDKVRFVNSGTEAIMACIKASRAHTGRAMIAKAEGAYHGQYDYAEVSQAPGPSNWGERDRPVGVPVAHGTPAKAISDVVILPYNDIDRAIALLDEHKGQLACVLLDLMPHRVGLRPAEADFVQAIREWTEKDGALLVYDEVITFRSTYGGAQQWFDVDPDLTALGKMIGGGFPVGAIAGKEAVMDIMNPKSDRYLFPHSGTFSANPVTMTAGLETMRRYDQAAVDRVNGLTARLMTGVTEAIARTGVDACITGGGSMFRVHLKAQPPTNYREAYSDPEELKRLGVVLDHLFDSGFMMINTCSGTLSTAMGEAEVDEFVGALEGGLGKIR